MSRPRMVLIALVVAGLAAAATLGVLRYFEGDPKALYDAVARHHHAFRANDLVSAYGQMSSGVRMRVNLPEFESLAHTQYFALGAAPRIALGASWRRGRHAGVQVFLLHRNGAILPARYRLVAEPDGWKVEWIEVHDNYPSVLRDRSIEI